MNQEVWYTNRADGELVKARRADNWSTGQSGYLVTHIEGGAREWLGALTFHDRYAPVLTEPLTFGEALELCKKGAKISRRGWNGRGQYVELATHISYTGADGTRVEADHTAIGNAALAFVGTSGVQLGWLASQADMLAEDWRIIE